MHAMRDRERKNLHRGKGGCHGRLIKETTFLCLKLGRGDADEPVVVGKYTRTRQRWLKGKIVKSSHGRSYKKTSLCLEQRSKKQEKNMREKNRVKRK